MAEKPMIYETINNVMGEIGAIGKDKRSNQGFNYRGVDDVMNALNPAFIRHKLFLVPEVLEQSREERTTKNGAGLIYSICKMKYTFYAVDGSHVEAVVIGEGMDSGDKATNKAMAIAFKYACFQLFCIPTEEMAGPDARPVDPDKEGHQVKTASSAKRTTQKSGTVSEKKATDSSNGTVKQGTDSMVKQPGPTVGSTASDRTGLVTEDMIQELQKLVGKYSAKGLKMEKILKMYSIKNIIEMSTSQYEDCMKKLELYKKRETENE